MCKTWSYYRFKLFFPDGRGRSSLKVGVGGIKDRPIFLAMQAAKRAKAWDMEGLRRSNGGPYGAASN